VKEADFDERGIIKKGVIARLQALPGYLEDLERIIKSLYKTYGDRIFINSLTCLQTPGSCGKFK